MRFSIVTITYNAEKYLRETLESVSEQAYRDFEHIVWDGGSTDGTLEIVRSFPDVRLYEGKDGGISDAMNKGASFARGDFLIHLHADDSLVDAGALGRLATFLGQHPQAEWVYGEAVTIDSEGVPLNTLPARPFSHRRLRRYNTLTHPSVAVSRALFSQVEGFDPSLKLCMDYDLWLRLAPLSTPLALPAPLAAFRVHPASTSTAVPRAVADEAYRVRNRYTTSLWERWRSYRTWRRRIKKT